MSAQDEAERLEEEAQVWAFDVLDRWHRDREQLVELGGFTADEADGWTVDDFSSEQLNRLHNRYYGNDVVRDQTGFVDEDVELPGVYPLWLEMTQGVPRDWAEEWTA